MTAAPRTIGVWAARVLAGLAAAAAFGGPQTAPTPAEGPAARAGESIDRAWDHVSSSVAEALLTVRVRVARLERLKEDGLRVTIEVHGSDVQLSGQVEHGANVRLAERVAASVNGVRTVRSRVTAAGEGAAVEPPVAHVLGKVEHTVADALLEARVKGRLLGELGKTAFQVSVDASNGVVTLSGTVPDAERRRLASTVAKSTSGVKEVRDLLAVQ